MVNSPRSLLCRIFEEHTSLHHEFNWLLKEHILLCTFLQFSRESIAKSWAWYRISWAHYPKWIWIWVNKCFANVHKYDKCGRMNVHLLGVVYTMDHEVGRGKWLLSMVRVHGRTFVTWLLEKLVLRVLGPSLGVNRMWTKKNDHAPKSEGVGFLIHAQKGKFWKKSSLTILLSSLGLHLSSPLVKCVEDVACKSSQNNFHKKKSDLICACSM